MPETTPNRTLAIGDIHGCYDALRLLCDVLKLRAEDTIVTLGDYPDRGPNTHAVFDFLLYLDNHHNLVPLKGNHDIMMLDARKGGDKLDRWLAVGGKAAIQSYSPSDDTPGRLADIPDAHWDFLQNRLLPYYETATHFFVHANAYPDVPLDDQPDYMRYWEKFNWPPRHTSGKIMVCGHTSQKSGLPIVTDDAICIDTWCCGTGWLSCLHVESKRIYQANNEGDVRQFWLDESPEPDCE